jgi:hypothetical protein
LGFGALTELDGSIRVKYFFKPFLYRDFCHEAELSIIHDEVKEWFRDFLRSLYGYIKEYLGAIPLIGPAPLYTEFVFSFPGPRVI